MSAWPFPHAITVTQAPEEQSQHLQRPSAASQHQTQPRLEHPSPLESPSEESENPMRHYYSPLLSSPPLGSSPASVIYSPLPEHTQSEIVLQMPTQHLAPSSQTVLQTRTHHQTLSPPSNSDFKRQHSAPAMVRVRVSGSRSQSELQPLLEPVARSSGDRGQAQAQRQNQIQNQPQAQTRTQIQTITHSSHPHPHPSTSPALRHFNHKSPHPNLPSFAFPFPISPSSSSSSFSSSSPENVDEEREREDGGDWTRPGEEHAQEMRVRRAKHMCAWFSAVLGLGLLGVGSLRWWVYG